MDLGRDEYQENIIEDIIRDGDDDVTSLFLNNSSEGDDQNRRNGSVIHPFCITILYPNLLLFIDIFHI
jgi:hypothetical protein